MIDVNKHALLLQCETVLNLIKENPHADDLELITAKLNDLLGSINKEVVPLNGNQYSKHVMDTIGIVEGEPIFVLKGRDPIAPDLIYKWANIRQAIQSGRESQKVIDARDLAAHFGLWKNKNPESGLHKKYYDIYCREQYLRNF